MKHNMKYIMSGILFVGLTKMHKNLGFFLSYCSPTPTKI
jgi:hypothetical protein